MKQIFLDKDKRLEVDDFKIKNLPSQPIGKKMYGRIGKVMLAFAIPWIFFAMYELRKSGVYLWEGPLISFCIGLFFLIPGLHMVMSERKLLRKNRKPILKVTKRMKK